MKRQTPSVLFIGSLLIQRYKLELSETLTIDKMNFNTYALTVTSNKMAATGIMHSPSQKAGDENSNPSMPTNTAANGIDGQKLLLIQISAAHT